jgi:hypothetical protein
MWDGQATKAGPRRSTGDVFWRNVAARRFGDVVPGSLAQGQPANGTSKTDNEEMGETNEHRKKELREKYNNRLLRHFEVFENHKFPPHSLARRTDRIRQAIPLPKIWQSPWLLDRQIPLRQGTTCRLTLPPSRGMVLLRVFLIFTF